MVEVGFVFPRHTGEGSPPCFGNERDVTPMTSHKPVRPDSVNLDTLRPEVGLRMIKGGKERG